MLSAQIDHDIQSSGFKIPDFTVSKFSLPPTLTLANQHSHSQHNSASPFIDLLHDGYSTFSYNPIIFISNHPIAIAGSEAYDGGTIVATFDPPLDPYAAKPGGERGEVYFDVFRSGVPVLNATFFLQGGGCGEVGEYPLSL